MVDNRLIIGGTSATTGDILYVGASESVMTVPYKTTLRLSDETLSEIRRALGYLEKPLVKCVWCGQWGAAYCECRYCGQPIDPEE